MALFAGLPVDGPLSSLRQRADARQNPPSARRPRGGLREQPSPPSLSRQNGRQVNCPDRTTHFDDFAPPGVRERARACENNAVTKYAVVIHEEPQGGYWAEVPALPGCYSQGDSVDDLMANVREAISGVLAVMCEEGTQPESNIQILDIAV